MRIVQFIILALVLLLGGCTHSKPTSSFMEQPGPYRLDTGDTVRVTVYDDEYLSDTFQVGDAGNISMPLVGNIPARGLTTEMLSRNVASALANGYVRNPSVAIEIAEYRPFYIQGAVETSGQFAYAHGLTIRAAISVAGGFTASANRNSVTLYRRQGNEMVTSGVGLDFLVLPGDTIVVSERWL